MKTHAITLIVLTCAALLFLGYMASLDSKPKPAAPAAAVSVEDQPTITLRQLEITARGLAFQAMDTGLLYGYACAQTGGTAEDVAYLRTAVRSNRLDLVAAWFNGRTNTTTAPAQ